jgi:hypothetical protein
MKSKSANREKTHCPHGHAYKKPNLIVFLDKEGRKHRACRKCNLEKALKYYRDKVKPLHPRRPGRPREEHK